MSTTSPYERDFFHWTQEQTALQQVEDRDYWPLAADDDA